MDSQNEKDTKNPEEEEEKGVKVKKMDRQKYSRLRELLQKFSSLFKAEPMYEGIRLKVILLLQVSSHDFEPTFIIFCLNLIICTARPAKIKTNHQTFDS